MKTSEFTNAFLFVHHNQIESIKITLSNFIDYSDVSALYLLVDNSENENISLEIEETIQQRNWPVELLVIRNKGYGHAVNSGLDYIKNNYPQIEHLIVVTHDVRYVSGRISSLIQQIDSDNKLAIIGPRIINSGFFASEKSLIWSDGGRLTFFLKRPVHINFGRIKDSSIISKYVTWVDGCFLVIDLKKLSNTRFDVAYFMYLEDVDFCIQTTRAGFKIAHSPLLTVSQETNGVPSKVFETNFRYFIRKFFRSRILLVDLALIARRLWRQR